MEDEWQSDTAKCDGQTGKAGISDTSVYRERLLQDSHGNGECQVDDQAMATSMAEDCQPFDAAELKAQRNNCCGASKAECQADKRQVRHVQGDEGGIRNGPPQKDIP